MTQFKIYIIIAVVIAFVAVGVYIKYLQGENKTLTENNAKLTVAVQTQKETITVMQANAETARVAQTTLYKEYSVSRKENAKLTRLLSRHDLKYLAQRKPGLIENRVNKATEKVNECIAQMSKEKECK